MNQYVIPVAVCLLPFVILAIYGYIQIKVANINSYGGVKKDATMIDTGKYVVTQAYGRGAEEKIVKDYDMPSDYRKGCTVLDNLEYGMRAVDTTTLYMLVPVKRLEGVMPGVVMDIKPAEIIDKREELRSY